MLMNIIRTRFKQGNRTLSYPDGPPPSLPARFPGLPEVDTSRCSACNAPCLIACPTCAISRPAENPAFDLGLCVFCRECEHACPYGAIAFGKNHRMASSSKRDLIVEGNAGTLRATNPDASSLFNRVFSIRVVSAGGCGACEADTNVLNTLAWDLGRFGVQFVASPRHADALLLIGPVPENMEHAVKDTYDAIPSPKFVIATGACAISGGMFANRPECLIGKGAVLPTDLYIPGCPPHPLTILDGILRFLGRIPD